MPKPKNESPPGSKSRRVDKRDVPSPRPSLDRPDIQSGDVSRLEAARKSVPIASQGSGQPPMNMKPLSEIRGRGMPENYMFGSTNRPDEPLTEGMSIGPGAGPEVLPQRPPETEQEIFLSWLAGEGNEDARSMLNEMRQPPPVAPPAMMAPPGPAPAPAPEAAAPEQPMPAEAPEDADFEDMDLEDEVAPEEVAGGLT